LFQVPQQHDLDLADRQRLFSFAPAAKHRMRKTEKLQTLWLVRHTVGSQT
jgi:hypothetical protein